MPQTYITVLYIFLCSQCHMIGDCPSREKRYVVNLNKLNPIMLGACPVDDAAASPSLQHPVNSPGIGLLKWLHWYVTIARWVWVCLRALRVLYVSLNHYQRLGAIWPDDLWAFSPLHLLETFLVFPRSLPVCNKSVSPWMRWRRALFGACFFF